jgi:hypothetical protein
VERISAAEAPAEAATRRDVAQLLDELRELRAEVSDLRNRNNVDDEPG